MKKPLVALLSGLLLVGMATGCQKSEQKGLTANYYNNATLKGDPLKTKIVPNIDFVWGAPPYKYKPLNNPFGIIFTGQVFIPETQPVTFYLDSDDGSELYIDDKRLLSNKGIQPQILQGRSITKTFDKGWHKLKVTYFDLEGGAFVNLSWQLPGGEKQLIEPRFLKP